MTGKISIKKYLGYDVLFFGSIKIQIIIKYLLLTLNYNYPNVIGLTLSKLLYIYDFYYTNS